MVFLFTLVSNPQKFRFHRKPCSHPTTLLYIQFWWCLITLVSNPRKSRFHGKPYSRPTSYMHTPVACVLGNPAIGHTRTYSDEKQRTRQPSKRVCIKESAALVINAQKIGDWKNIYFKIKLLRIWLKIKSQIQLR